LQGISFTDATNFTYASTDRVPIENANYSANFATKTDYVRCGEDDVLVNDSDSEAIFDDDGGTIQE
jgi:hypothetical protein